ncbi:MAG: hypothetical protein VB047_03845 [Anaerotignum propionicum]|uniref:hypothetical protein n=1 Tax=Anaerotignum propionicum TaxID=28446 RepID=UPI002B1FE133|nr:hypothetical protein [Anaerotignum propionicum]MEA5056672.1 hypothetical protein [Anaerotignum propionicum]
MVYKIKFRSIDSFLLPKLVSVLFQPTFSPILNPLTVTSAAIYKKCKPWYDFIIRKYHIIINVKEAHDEENNG